MINLESERQYFIENGGKATYFQWLRSKGTNFTCYEIYTNSLNEEEYINNQIDIIRTIIYALHKPIQFTFFYWTLLIFILHKFNFKKTVLKIILVHFILRSLGDVIDKFGDLMPRYYSNTPITDVNGNTIGYQCKNDSPSPEMHPLRWFLTRQIGCIFWLLGEMVADWYPLIRTKAVAKEQKSLWIVYVSCGLFNISKLSLIIYHWTLSPTELYDENGVYQKTKVDLFYFKYWMIHLIIIYSSFIYDFSVYYVVKKSLSYVKTSEIGFLRKFKSFSQFRILVTAGVCAVFLPIISVTIIIKFYFYNKYHYHNLEFSFDEIRQSINNVQYFMIFIDQILLIHSNEEETRYSVNISINDVSSIDDKEKSNLNSSFINYNTLKSNYSNYTLDHNVSKGKNDYGYSTLKSNYSNYTLDSSLSKEKNDKTNHRKLRSNSNSSITLTENSNENQTLLRTNRSNSYNSSYYFDNLCHLSKSNSNIDNLTLNRYNRSNSFSSNSAYNSIHSINRNNSAYNSIHSINRNKRSNSIPSNYNKNNSTDNKNKHNNVNNNKNNIINNENNNKNNIINNTNNNTNNNINNNKNGIINNSNSNTNHNNINNNNNNSIIYNANNSTNFNNTDNNTSLNNINNNTSIRQSKIFNCNNNNIYTNDNVNFITINNNNNIIDYNSSINENFITINNSNNIIDYNSSINDDNYSNRNSDLISYDNTLNGVDWEWNYLNK